MTFAGDSHGASFDRVVSAIHAAGGGRVQEGSGYTKVCCPAHGESNPSCSVRYDAAKGKTSVHCFVCDSDEPVLAAAGLSVGDLYDEPRAAGQQGKRTSTSSNGLVELDPQQAHNGKAAKADTSPTAGSSTSAGSGGKLRQQQVGEYIYHDAEGAEVGKVVRYDLVDTDGTRMDKTFRPKRRNPNTGRWVFGGFDAVLYHLPEVAAAIAAGELVYVFEGEKDADAARDLGLVATTNAGGAKSFSAEHAHQLAGARVVAVLDRDEAGYDRGVRLNQLLFTESEYAAAELRIVEPVEGKDFYLHISSGHTAEDLVDVDPAAKLAELRPAKPEDELTRRRQQRQPHHEDTDDDQSSPAPQWSIATSSGTWAYSTGADGEPPRGVYRGGNAGWQHVGPLPHVLERLTARDGHTRRSGMSYRIAMSPLAEADDVAIVNDDELKSGAWADKLDVATSADTKVVAATATAIRDTARRHAEVREIVPRWSAGQLEMPPTDVGPAGYGQMQAEEGTAQRTWQHLITLAAQTPKLALVLGAGLGALYVRPLERQSFVLLATGGARRGKTTALACAAALYGDPHHLVQPWNLSPIGLTQELGGLATLPSFRDELAAAGIRGRDLEKLVFQVTEGAQRTIGSRDGRSPRTSASWHGVLFATSNDTILGEVSNEGTAARVVEVPTPITHTAADAKELTRLARQAYGWPLHWLRQDPDIEQFAELTEQAGQALALPEGGVPETIGEHLTLAVAGARKLEQLTGGSGIYEATVNAGRALLDEMVAELEERGSTAGERLKAALREASSTRPTAFPTRPDYRASLEGAVPNTVAREVEGWDVSEETTVTGDLAVTSKALRQIAVDAEIHNLLPALRELRDEGCLVGDSDGKSRYQQSLRLTTAKKTKAYVFRFGQGELLPRTGNHTDLDDSGDTDPTSNDTSPSTASDPTEQSPLPHCDPTDDDNSGDTIDEAVTRTDDPDTRGECAPVPDVPTLSEQVACENDIAKGKGVAGPVRYVAGHLHDTCRLCGEGSPPFVDDLGTVHPFCAQNPPQPQQPPATTETEPTLPRPADHQPNTDHTPAQQPSVESHVVQDHVELTGPTPPQPTGYRAACVVADPSGLYLPNGIRYQGVPITDGADLLNAGEKLSIGHPGGPGQLILTDSMCLQLGLVAQADDGLPGDEARDQVRQRLGELDDTFLARARQHGWDIGRLRVETRARRGDRVFDLVLAPYEYLWTRGREDSHPLGALDENLSEAGYAAEAARIMGQLAHHLQLPWRSNPRQVGWDLFDKAQRARSRRKGHVLTQPGRLPTLTGDVTTEDLVPALTWSRWNRQHPADEHDQARINGARYAVHLDRMAAWLGSGKQATLGYCTNDQPEMRHHTGADTVGALLQRPEAIPAGIMRLRVPACPDPAVVPMHGHQSPTGPRWLWLPTPLAASLLYDDDPTMNTLGWGATIADLVTPGDDEPEQRQAEAWTFPAQGRLLDDLWYERLRDARYAFDASGDDVAASLIKRTYAAFLQTSQNTHQAVLDGPRAWQHQATWLATVKAHHYAWQWTLLQRARYAGLLVASVQIDEVVVLVDNPTDAVLGRMQGRIGQYKVKTIRELSDEHRAQLAAGTAAHELEGGEQ